MVLSKKWFRMLAVITAVLLLGACGSKESVNDNPTYTSGGSQDGSPNDILPLSVAFEQYPVWYSTGSDPDRGSEVSRIYFFEKGNVELYEFVHENPSIATYIDKTLTLEEITKMSDEEILKHARKYGKEKDIGAYTINIKLDDYGNNTERLDVLVQEFALAQGKIEDSIGGFPQEPVNVTISGTNFSGFQGFHVTGRTYSYGQGNFLTRVDKSFAGFKLDEPNAKGKNVTIEEK